MIISNISLTHPSILLLALTFFLTPLPSVHSWGKDGHEIVANIAYSRLSNHTRNTVDKILSHDDQRFNDDSDSDDPNSPLGKVTNWADHIRDEKPWSTQLHYVNVRDGSYPTGCHDPSDKCEFVYERDCPEDRCAVGAIRNYTSRLYDEKYYATRRLRGVGFSDASKADMTTEAVEALKFVTHFIGDIHQPLHASRSSDIGGNAFRVDFDETTLGEDEAWNLHSVWDSGIVLRLMREEYHGSRGEMESSLLDMIEGVYAEYINDWLTCLDVQNIDCATEWAQEGFRDALQWAYTDENDVPIKDGSYISNIYYETRIHVVKQRLAMAGVRLAQALEEVFDRDKEGGSSILRLYVDHFLASTW